MTKRVKELKKKFKADIDIYRYIYIQNIYNNRRGNNPKKIKKIIEYFIIKIMKEQYEVN